MRRAMMLFVASMVLATTAEAAVPTTQSIETLLTTLRLERTLDSMWGNLDAVMKQAMNSAFGAQALTPEQERIRDTMSRKVVKMYREELTWAKMEPLYVSIYQETFTQDEIDQLTAFYRTPAGASYVEKQPIVLQKSLMATQSLIGPLMERLRTLMQETVEEVNATK